MLILVQKYEAFLVYSDMLLQQIPRERSNIRDLSEKLFQDQVELLYSAAKSGMASRVYAADAGLAAIEQRLRFLSETKYTKTKWRGEGSAKTPERTASYLVSKKAASHASKLLIEVKAMIGSMVEKSKKVK